MTLTRCPSVVTGVRGLVTKGLTSPTTLPTITLVGRGGGLQFVWHKVHGAVVSTVMLAQGLNPSLSQNGIESQKFRDSK